MSFKVSWSSFTNIFARFNPPFTPNRWAKDSLIVPSTNVATINTVIFFIDLSLNCKAGKVGYTNKAYP